MNGLEINGRITEVYNIPALTAGYGDFKDKAVDLKYQFIPEGKFMPAVAAGIMDPNGTGLYASEYIVAGKQIYPFDFTLGLGSGRLDGFFWGVQFAPSEKYAFMLEYSPIKYHEQTGDPAREKYFREPVHSKYNFGLRFKPTKWSELGISYQRGNTLGLNASVAFDIGNPLVPIYDRGYRERPFEKKDPLRERLLRAINHSGFSDIGVAVVDDELWISAHNDKYFFSGRAVGVLLGIIADINPENISRVHVVLTERGLPVTEFACLKSDLIGLFEERMSPYDFFLLSEFKTGVSGMPEMSIAHKKSWSYGVRPILETFLNDPSGFFKYRLGLQGWINYQPWEGTSFIAGLATYPLNNFSTVNEPLSIPVRSDIVLYKEKDVALNRLMFDRIKKVTPEIYGRFSAGLLEIQYAGVDAEVAAPVFDGRVYLGLSGSVVRKRDPGNILNLKHDDVKDGYATAFVNARLNLPETGMALDIKAGRFLAGDYGARFTISKFINGVAIRAWYSVTDTSVFNDSFNRGYHDKGISVSIPLRLFKGTDSRSSYDYALSPWTRDTGQDIDHFGTLFDFIGRNTKVFLDKEKLLLFNQKGGD